MQFLMGILKDFILQMKGISNVMMEVLIVGSKDFILQCNVLQCHDGSFDCGIQGFYPSMQRVTMS